MGLPWVRLDCTFAQSPFLFPVSDRAFRLHVMALCSRAANHRTDLFIPADIALFHARFLSRRQPHRYIDELVESGAWTPKDDGYVMDGFNAYVGLPSERRPLIDPVVRESIYERDGYACLMCGAREALSLDHIVPFSMGGDDSYSNLRTLCTPCNSRRGAGRVSDENLRSEV